MWAGPEGTGTRQTCFGTEHSAMFLEMLNSAMKAYRQAFAQEVTNPLIDILDATPEEVYFV